MGVDASEAGERVGCMGMWWKGGESKEVPVGCLNFRRDKEEKGEGKEAGAEVAEKGEKPASLLKSVSTRMTRALRSISSNGRDKAASSVKPGDVIKEVTEEGKKEGENETEAVTSEGVKEEKSVEVEAPISVKPEEVKAEKVEDMKVDTPQVAAHVKPTAEKVAVKEGEKTTSGNKLVAGSGPWPAGSALARHNVAIMGTGEELLFMSHGFGTNQQIWGSVLEDFDLVNKYKVVVWDLMGAYSTNPEGFDFQRYSTLHGYADDLLEVLDELEIEEMTYVGHSVSGMVGIIASTERPQIFKRLILIGASPRYLDMPGYKGGFTLEMLDQVFAAMQDNYKAWASGFAPMVVGEDVDSVAVREFCRAIFLIRPDIAFSTLKTIFTCDLRYILPQVTKQVHLLQTARDAAVPWEPVQYMLDHLPNACVEMIPVAGHLPHLTHPKIVADAVLRHLAMPIRPLPSTRIQDESFRSGHSLTSGFDSGRLGSGELQPTESFEEY